MKILQKKSAAQVLSKAHANESVRRTMQTVGKAGKACTVISIGIGVYTVGLAESGERPRVATRVVGEFAGSVAGAWSFGTTAGAMWGRPGGIWGSVIGTIMGAVIGGVGGGNIADVSYDVFVDN